MNTSQIQSINGLNLQSLEGLENLYLPKEQQEILQKKDFYLFGAYFDSRGPDVKILGMTQGKPLDLYCNIWFSKGIEPKVIKASHKYIWNKDWKWKPHLLNPYLFSCTLPANWMMNKQGHFPKAVSLIGERCQRTSNLLKVNHPVKILEENEKNDQNEQNDLENFSETKTKDFMVCVKGLDYPEDISYKLIEWIELIRLLGADKIHFYILNVHENVAKVLGHYKQVGWIITEGLSIPGPSLPSSKNRPQKKRHELIPYNDCFYKHREDYKYVILLDVDEIIMPNIGTWKDLIAKMQNLNPDIIASTFSVPNAYFFDETLKNNALDNPETDSKLHMLRTLHRTKNITQPSLFIKGFHNASDVVTVHNHFPIECAHGKCTEVKIHEDIAKLAHYRSCPVLLGDKCHALIEDYVKDDGILRFKHDLLRNIQKSVRDIKLS